MERRKEKRNTNTHSIVLCYVKQEPAQAKHEFEMWVRDISNSGIGLRWLKWWYCRKCQYCLSYYPQDNYVECKLSECVNLDPASLIKEGTRIVVYGMLDPEFKFTFLSGKVMWTKKSLDGSYFDLGVKIE